MNANTFNKTVFLDGRVKLFGGDSLAILALASANSIDAIITDPPYALVSIVKRFGNGQAPAKGNQAFVRASAGFMGKTWDNGDTAHNVAFWRECWRVLKPGGYVLAFGGTRTYHRLACAIEDAGFDVRDMVQWLYGSGFPKSHDVSKGIDRAGGISPRDQATMLRQRREAASMSRDDLASAVGCTVSSIRDWEEGRARATGRALEWIVPSDDYRAKLADLLGYSADERRLIGVAIDRRGDETVIGLGHSGELRSGGHTDAAREWQGWGTALKPACEPICMARKPLSEGTVAANVLRWGTGAINIDGCRVGTEGGTMRGAGASNAGKARNTLHGGNFGVEKLDDGRFPANVITDGSDEVVAMFPTQKSGGNSIKRASAKGVGGRSNSIGAESRPEGTRMIEHPDKEGSAARFFYQAKANKADRAGSKHPTVKPIALMRYLCRLVTPPGGTVLDPFAGSGTTGEAARLEGFNAILIEREAEYLADIGRRFTGEGSPEHVADIAEAVTVEGNPEHLADIAEALTMEGN